jgi:hypothetical protein
VEGDARVLTRNEEKERKSFNEKRGEKEKLFFGG